MTKKRLPVEAHFIANYLARFNNAYKNLGYSTQVSLHRKVSEILNIDKESSFKRLRDEYDGLYNNERKGYQNVDKRKLRVDFKTKFENLNQLDYTEKVKSLLIKSDISLLFNDEMHETDKQFEEGKLSKIYINKYERNIKARNESLKMHGHTCQVCGFKAFEKYGNISILEVHHSKPISKIKKTYIVNPKTDLKPLCPNCHRAIHSKIPPYTIEELKEIIKKNIH